MLDLRNCFVKVATFNCAMIYTADKKSVSYLYLVFRGLLYSCVRFVMFKKHSNLDISLGLRFSIND